MGIFSKIRDFQQSRNEKKIAKALKIIKNPKAIRDDRLGAIDFFLYLKDESIAIPCLMNRFEYSLEHGINDSREKEDVLAGIIERGDVALPHVRDHLKKTTRIAWPIKVLKALGKEDEVIEILKDALNFDDVSFDQAQVDKNYDILCYLIDYQLPGFIPRLAHFLDDPDERVRFACTEVLIEQQDPAVPGALEKYLTDFTAENTRLHQAAAEAFLKNGWKVGDIEKYPGGKVTRSIVVTEDGTLEGTF